jgi:hypothetical protein
MRRLSPSYQSVHTACHIILPVYAMQVLEALESAHPGMWSAYSAVLYGEPAPQVSALTQHAALGVALIMQAAVARVDSANLKLHGSRKVDVLQLVPQYVMTMPAPPRRAHTYR